MSLILNNFATQLGISPWILAIVLIWSAVWKLLAMWKSARKSSVVWFIVFAITNTLGILPILYLYVFSKMDFKRKVKKSSGKKVAKKKSVKKKPVKKKVAKRKK